MAAADALKIDWCGIDAARTACLKWHYSRSVPTPPLVRFGVWEFGQFIGVVLYSRGASTNIGKPYGLRVTEICELTRIALRAHVAPVSRIVAITLRLLTKANPGLRLVVSFADPAESHIGAIYQAGNWLYTGTTPPAPYYIDKGGRKWHSRQCSSTGVTVQYGLVRRAPKISDCTRLVQPGKYRYLMPLDATMRAHVAPLARPYPKRGRSAAGGTTEPTVGGGSIPTRPLHLDGGAP